MIPTEKRTPDYRHLIDEVLPTEELLERYFDLLWPICRSITGDGLRKSLSVLSQIAPLEPFEISTGTKVLDWTIPNEWNIEDAWVEDETGSKIIDFKKNNLHVLNYSTPIDEWFDLKDLQPHLHSLPSQKDAIPYLTSYYQERWGFCLSDSERKKLKPGKYHAVIRSSLKPGSLTLSHKILPATVKTSDAPKEILFSSYLCHPSMANNELSGPLVTAFLYAALSKIPERRFTYRFVVVPETIGAISYLSKFGSELKERLHAGFVVTCCGDSHHITYKKSRQGNATVDKVTIQELGNYGKPFEVVDYFPVGSDERQYCSPGFNLPVGSLMRTMYGKYPEYHTSLDNKDFISFGALRESTALYLRICLCLEQNKCYRNTKPLGEPMLSARGLYPTLGSQKEPAEFVSRMLWVLNQSDGTHDLSSIAERAYCSILDLAPIATLLTEKGLLEEV